MVVVHARLKVVELQSFSADGPNESDAPAGWTRGAPR